MNDVPLKRCPHCKEMLPATREYFYTRNAKPDGLDTYCKPCWRDIWIKRGKPNHTPEYSHRYYEANKERVKKRTSEYAQAHKTECQEWYRNYAKTEKGKANKLVYGQTRRARRYAGGKHTSADIRKQYEQQKGKCYWCHKKLSKGKNAYHVDHVIPLAKGGSNDISNIVIACPSCNLHKSDKILTLF